MRYSEALEMVRHVQALARVCKCSRHDAADKLHRLVRFERRANRLGLRLCDGPEFPEGGAEKENAAIMAGVVRVLGVHPRGLLVNQDPRGSGLLKIEDPGRVWDGAVKDWGGYVLLCPWFGGRS